MPVIDPRQIVAAIGYLGNRPAPYEFGQADRSKAPHPDGKDGMRWDDRFGIEKRHVVTEAS